MKIKRYIEFVNESKEYGTRESVESWVGEIMNIKNYRINEDLSVDVGNNVNISNITLLKIPVKFNLIDGFFACFSCKLTSLENCPNIVMESFDCGDNLFKNLLHSPKKVESYRCLANELTSLEGLPIDINLNYLYVGNINLKWNWLESILTEDESNIRYHIEWITKHINKPDTFMDKFGHLLDFEYYTKTL